MAEPTKYFVALWHEKIVARFSSNIVWTKHFECSRPGNLNFMVKVMFSYIRSTRRLSWSIEILPGRDPIERDLTRVFERHLTSVELLVYRNRFRIASPNGEPLQRLSYEGEVPGLFGNRISVHYALVLTYDGDVARVVPPLFQAYSRIDLRQVVLTPESLQTLCARLVDEATAQMLQRSCSLPEAVLQALPDV